MLFNSVRYVIFLPIVLLIYFLIPLGKGVGQENKYRNFFLLLASYFFYMCWIPGYAVLIGFSTVTTFFAALFMEHIHRQRLRKMCLILNILLNFGILFAFKYFNFFAVNTFRVLSLLGISQPFPLSQLVLPVGISFYTFQSIGYTIDIYRQDIPCERNFIRYALFVSFFPQLVAGPIERADNLLPQFSEVHRFSYTNAVLGLRLILFGMFKKVVIADTAAVFVNAVFNDIHSYYGLTLVTAVVLFSIQIYCDFSGYSDIAVGSAKMLGFQLMENFHSPYLSQSIADFWRRWHISLNTWFHNYVYVPLGGGRTFWKKCRNLFFVFALSGLWHGASWTYVAWGLVNGIYRVGQEFIRKTCKPLEFHYEFMYRLKTGIKILLTYILICCSWIFFRAKSIGDAVYAFSNLLRDWSLDTLLSQTCLIINKNILDLHIVRIFYCSLLLISVLSLLAFDLIRANPKNNAIALDKLVLSIRPVILRRAVYVVLTILVIWMFLMQNSLFEAGQFIYFQF